MSELHNVPVFIPGDHITFEVTIDHKANLQEDQTTAYLLHHPSDKQIVCPCEAHETWKQDDHRRSVFRFRSERPIGLLPDDPDDHPYPAGEYRLGSVVVRTYYGSGIFLDKVPDVRCVVASEEPTEPPQCIDFKWT